MAFSFVLILVFELVYLAGSQRRGVLEPFQGSGLASGFFQEVLLGGVLLGLLLAPAMPHLFATVRLRILDTLEFPLLWLTMMLLLVGGVTAALFALFPRSNGGIAHLLLAVLYYAPAAWYLALGFLASDLATSERLLSAARRASSPKLIVGRILVQTEESGALQEA